MASQRATHGVAVVLLLGCLGRARGTSSPLAPLRAAAATPAPILWESTEALEKKELFHAAQAPVAAVLPASTVDVVLAPTVAPVSPAVKKEREWEFGLLQKSRWADQKDKAGLVKELAEEEQAVSTGRGEMPAVCIYPQLKLCGVFIPGRTCQCDAFCTQLMNCCPDYSTECNADGGADADGRASGGWLGSQRPSPLQASFRSDERLRLGVVACVTAIFSSVLWVTFHLVWTRRQLQSIRKDAEAAVEAQMGAKLCMESGTESDEAEYEAEVASGVGSSSLKYSV